MRTASELTHQRISARKARLHAADTQRLEKHVEQACKGKTGFERDLARLEAYMSGVCHNIQLHRVRPDASVVRHTQPTTRRTRQRGASSRSTAKSGDSNDDPEPERDPLALFDQSALADLLKISKKTVQNLYSRTPHLLPPAIAVPGARGPRWTPESVAEWLSSRPQHTTKTAPVAPRRKAGRTRIALRSAGGAA